MQYLIFENGVQVDTIVADEAFVETYCKENGYTYAEIEQPEAPHVPTANERIAALEEQYAAIEDALCEMDAANSASIAAIEDALCEMDKEG